MKRILTIAVVLAVGVVGVLIRRMTPPEGVVHVATTTIHIGADETFVPPPASGAATS